jgi:hypothetical protein
MAANMKMAVSGSMKGLQIDGTHPPDCSVLQPRRQPFSNPESSATILEHPVEVTAWVSTRHEVTATMATDHVLPLSCQRLWDCPTLLQRPLMRAITSHNATWIKKRVNSKNYDSPGNPWQDGEYQTFAVTSSVSAQNNGERQHSFY